MRYYFFSRSGDLHSTTGRFAGWTRNVSAQEGILHAVFANRKMDRYVPWENLTKRTRASLPVPDTASLTGENRQRTRHIYAPYRSGPCTRKRKESRRMVRLVRPYVGFEQWADPPAPDSLRWSTASGGAHCRVCGKRLAKGQRVLKKAHAFRRGGVPIWIFLHEQPCVPRLQIRFEYPDRTPIIYANDIYNDDDPDLDFTKLEEAIAYAETEQRYSLRGSGWSECSIWLNGVKKVVIDVRSSEEKEME